MPMAKQSIPNNLSSARVLGLDVGDARIGVAGAGLIAKLPEPITVVKNDDSAIAAIDKLAASEGALTIVVGLPRDQHGAETEQSAKARAFAKTLEEKTDYEVVFADESLSSKRAEAMLKDSGKDLSQLDAFAACFILEEFFNQEL